MVGTTAAVSVAFWLFLNREEHSHVRRISEVLTRSVEADISTKLGYRIQAQVRLAKLSSVNGRLSHRHWESQAKLFLMDHPGYLAAHWVDATYHVRQVVTAAEGEAYQSVLLATDAPLRRVLESLVNRGEKDATFTPAFRLSNGRSVRRIVVPIFSSETFLGFVIAVVDEEKAFEDILADHAGLGYAVLVFEDNGEEIYRLPGSSPENEKEWGQDVEFHLAGAAWRVRVWPNPRLLDEMESGLPRLELIAGLLIGLLLFATFDYARTAYRTTRAVHDSHGRLLEIISSAMDAIISVDESQRIVVFNQAAEGIFRCPSSEAIGQPLSKFIPERFREAHGQHIQNFGRTGISKRSMSSPGALWGVRADGEEFPLEASISQTKSATEKLYTVIVRDVSVRKRAEEELRRARDELEFRVQERTAELQSTNKKLEAEIGERSQAEESLRDLSGRLLQSKDEEQRRIARELHDSTAQILGALAIDLEKIQQLLPNGDILKAQQLLARSSELVEGATAEIRTISYLLHPPMLDDLGLEGALRWYAAGFSNRSGIQVNVDVQKDLGRFPQELELTLFRLVQEALTNIHRHSGSPTADISVFRDAHQVKLRITDHGHGIRPGILEPVRDARAFVGVGIAGMRERVRQLGGRLEIESGNDGTSIKAMLPIGDDRLRSEHDNNLGDTDGAQASSESPVTRE